MTDFDLMQIDCQGYLAHEAEGNEDHPGVKLRTLLATLVVPPECAYDMNLSIARKGFMPRRDKVDENGRSFCSLASIARALGVTESMADGLLQDFLCFARGAGVGISMDTLFPDGEWHTLH